MIIPTEQGKTPALTGRYDARATTTLLPNGVLRSFILVTGLFFLWGIPNNLNDVLIRQFMKSFVISRFQAGLVQSAFYMGYFLLALPAGILMKRKGYKAGLLTGLMLFSMGCFMFYPAANAGKYGFFLASLFVVASGLAFLETASNPLIAQLGPTATSERRLNLAQAFNPLGAITGVLVGTIFIFSGVELTSAQSASMQTAGTYAAYLHREVLRTVKPYLVLGGLALVWSLLIASTPFPAFLKAREHSAETEGNWRELLHRPHFLLAVATQFMYVGAQVGTWSYFIQYSQEYGHTSERQAGLLLTCTLGAFGVGRFASQAFMRKIPPSTMMAVYAATNVCLLLVGILHPGRLGLAAVLLTSFFMSIMFPTIFAMGLKDLGPNTSIAGSLLVMAIVGGAVLTPLMGLIAEHLHSTALAYQIPLLGYVAVGLYSRYMSSYISMSAMISTFEV